MEQRGKMKKQPAARGKRRLLKPVCRIMAVVMILAAIPAIPVITGERAKAEPTESSDFLMYVESVTTITGYGTVVSGTVINGSVNAGDRLIYAGCNADGSPRNNTVTIGDIEMYRKKIDRAKKGDTIGISLGNFPVDQVRIGDALISDDQSPYENHQGILCGTIANVGNGHSYSADEEIVISNIYVTMNARTVGNRSYVSWPTELNDCFYIYDTGRAHVFRIGEKFTIKVGGESVGTFRVNEIVSSASHAIGQSSYWRLTDGGSELDHDAFSDPYPRYAWIPAVEDGRVIARSGNSGLKSTNSSLEYKTDFPGQTTIKFDYKPMVEGNGDRCRFTVDGQTMISYNTPKDDWYQYTLTLSPGPHTLTWEYLKNENELAADDYFAIRDLAVLEPEQIILDGNGGCFTDHEDLLERMLKVDVNYNENFLVNKVLTPTRYDYVFRGFSTDPVAGKEKVVREIRWRKSILDSHPTTYYAVWAKEDFNLKKTLDFSEDGQWTAIDADNDGEKWKFEDIGRLGTCMSSRSWFEGAPNEYFYLTSDDWLISPAVKLGNMKYSLRFWAENPQTLSVYAGTSPDPSKMKKIADYSSVSTDSFREYTAKLDGFENKTVYFAFRHYNPTNSKNSATCDHDPVVVEYPRIVTEFSDVRTGSDKGKDPYYYAPVYWASQNGITGGVKDDNGVYSKFDPQATCTRAQMVSFLWRFAGCPEPKTYTNFKDVSQKAYYYKAVSWAQENGITGGYSDGTFGPDKPCTRGQAVTFLNRMHYSEKAHIITEFSDVKPGTYYYNAVLWAEEYGITGGYSDGTFRPDNTCTRAQMVTFLYRFDRIPQG